MSPQKGYGTSIFLLNKDDPAKDGRQKSKASQDRLDRPYTRSSERIKPFRALILGEAKMLSNMTLAVHDWADVTDVMQF